MLSFKLKKQASTNVADTTFKWLPYTGFSKEQSGVERNSLPVGNFVVGRIFLLVGGNLARNDFLPLKTTLCKFWTSIKIKISMTCVYREYEVKIKMVQQQWLQLKVKNFRVWIKFSMLHWEKFPWNFTGFNVTQICAMVGSEVQKI